MPRELPILLGLAAVAGLVDAASFLGLGHVFTANMTGNLVLLGFAATGVHELSVWRSLAALGSYLLGALCGARAVLVLDRRRSRGGGALVNAAPGGARGAGAGGVAFGIEPVVLLAATVLAWLCGAALERSSAAAYAVIVLAGIAMGARNGAARRLGIPHVATTVETTNLTRLAAESRAAGGNDRDLAKLGASVLAMLAGAALGAWLLRYSVAAPLGCGVILSSGCAMLAHSLCKARGS